MNDEPTTGEVIDNETITNPQAKPLDDQGADTLSKPRVVTNLRDAAALVPVDQRMQSLAHEIDFAQYVAKAGTAVPAHLRGNVGMALAVVDIATRSNLSPFLLASKTYVQNDRLCFESQAFHALAQSSGQIKGHLRCRYEGEGEEMKCIVWGTLAGETEPHEHESPMLKDVRPKRNDSGTVKGSPLWDKKPKVQLFYDTSRDWCRMYCPGAVMGVYTPDDEFSELPRDPPKDVTELSNRLATNGHGKGEGFKAGHAHNQLNDLAPNAGGRSTAKTPPAGKGTGPKGSQAGTAAPAKGQPTTAKEYVAYAERWIKKATDNAEAWDRWEAEKEMRAALKVTIPQRKPLQAMLEKIK